MKIGTIIFLIIIVWQVISSIIQAAEKNKKKRDQSLNQQRRTVSQAAQSSAAPSPGRAIKSGSLTGRLKSRAEELTARRQAQLEELRRRRAGRSTSTGQTQVRTGAANPASGFQAPTTLPPRGKGGIKRQQADFKSVQGQLEVDRRRKAEQARKNLQEVNAAAEVKARREAAEVARRKAARQKARLEDEAATRRHPDATAERSTLIQRSGRDTTRGRVLRRALGNRQTLRELFVLKELLDQPLSIRHTDAEA